MYMRTCLIVTALGLILTAVPAPAEVVDQAPHVLLAQKKSSAQSKSPQAEMERLQARAELWAEDNNWSEAQKAYEQLYELQVRHHGSENQITLATRLSVADMLSSAGQYIESEEIYRELLEVQKRLTGPTSSETRNLLDKLAMALFKRWKYDEAKELWQQVFDLELEDNGEDGQAYSWTGTNLADTLVKLREYDQANRLYERVLAAKERLLTPEDQALLDTHSYYAQTLYDQGKYELAREHFQKTFQGRKKSWGGAVPMIDGFNLACTLAKLNDWEDYEKLTDEIFKFWEDSPPENIHESIYTTYTSLDCILRESGRPDQIGKLYARLLALAEKKLKPDTPIRGQLQLAHLAFEARLLEQEGKNNEALDSYSRMYELRKKSNITELYSVLEIAVRPFYISGQGEKADRMLAEVKNEIIQAHDAKSDFDQGIRILTATLPLRVIIDQYSPSEPIMDEDAARLENVVAELSQLKRDFPENKQRVMEVDISLARSLVYLGKLDQAEKILRDSRRLSNALFNDDTINNYSVTVACEQLNVGGHLRKRNEVLESLVHLRSINDGLRHLDEGKYNEAKTIFTKLRHGLNTAMRKAATRRLNEEAKSIINSGKSFAEGKELFAKAQASLDSPSGYLGRLLLMTDYYNALAEFNLGNLEAAEKLGVDTLRAMENLEGSRPDQDKARKLLEMIADKRSADRLAREADSLSARGKFNEAREVYSRIYSLLEPSLGLRHRETLFARFNVARMYELSGQSAAARDLYESLLPLQEKALGADHQDVLATRSRLSQLGSAPFAGGSLTLNRGGASGVNSAPADRETLSRQLAEGEKSQGKDHPDTLAVREKLADLMAAENELAKAEKEYAAIASLRERKQGREHLDTLKTREKQAQTLMAQGKSDQALKIFTQVLAVRERVQGTDHEDVETTLMGLVALYDQKGDSTAATTVTDRLQDIHDGKILKDDPTATPSSESTADMAAEFGSYKSALDGYERALAVKRRILGPEAPATLAVRQKLAAMKSRLGDHAGAKAEHNAILEIRNRLLGGENPATLESKLNLASACLALKDRVTAEKLMKEVLAVQERTLGAKHPDTLNTRQMLGL